MGCPTGVPLKFRLARRPAAPFARARAVEGERARKKKRGYQGGTGAADRFVGVLVYYGKRFAGSACRSPARALGGMRVLPNAAVRTPCRAFVTHARASERARNYVLRTRESVVSFLRRALRKRIYESLREAALSLNLSAYVQRPSLSLSLPASLSIVSP